MGRQSKIVQLVRVLEQRAFDDSDRLCFGHFLRFDRGGENLGMGVNLKRKPVDPNETYVVKDLASLYGPKVVRLWPPMTVRYETYETIYCK